MSLFGRKKGSDNIIEDSKIKERDYTPILHMARSIKGYQEELVKKEVSSLEELRIISETFDDVLEEDKLIKSEMDKFSDVFNEFRNTSLKFDDVKRDIVKTVSDAECKMNELSENSAEIQKQFSSIETVFGTLQESVESIAATMTQITDIANQTNMLALNASIEAARAGETGRGFAVVAEQVKNLANQIKILVQAVDENIEKVNDGTRLLNESIESTNNTLSGNMDKVRETAESLTLINEAASGADDVQNEISMVSDNAANELLICNSEFESIEAKYENVKYHILEANDLGTTKSVLFENIDNMLAQVSPLVDDLK
ncbi:MAG: chemotaxis protein [Lachnospiraceae bacterium]|nr:chemotaxis protein [Lachnospiraceae bacterium]